MSSKLTLPPASKTYWHCRISYFVKQTETISHNCLCFFLICTMWQVFIKKDKAWEFLHMLTSITSLPPWRGLLVAHANLFVHVPNCTSLRHLTCKLSYLKSSSFSALVGSAVFLGNYDYLKIVSKQIISFFYPLTITQWLCLFQSLCPCLSLFTPFFFLFSTDSLT